MPVYFGDVAPYCPVSRDSPIGPAQPWAPTVRTVIPRAYDLITAIAAVNILRTIVTQIVTDKVINNVHTPAPLKPRPDKVIDQRRHARWTEDQSKRIKRKYKYYAEHKGKPDPDNWVQVERIERMVWNDSGWKTTLVWSYGDGGGEPDSGGE